VLIIQISKVVAMLKSDTLKFVLSVFRRIDVFQAYKMIDNVKPEIQCLRDDTGVEFQRRYDESKQLAHI